MENDAGQEKWERLLRRRLCALQGLSIQIEYLFEGLLLGERTLEIWVKVC